MFRRLRGPLTRNRVLVCILTNQFATPGLGSWMGGRTIAGLGQLLLAIAGFGFVMTWMFLVFYRVFQRELGEPVGEGDLSWMWTWGASLFGAAWCWSLVTSISLWRQQRKAERDAGGNLPPRITNVS